MDSYFCSVLVCDTPALLFLELDMVFLRQLIHIDLQEREIKAMCEVRSTASGHGLYGAGCQANVKDVQGWQGGGQRHGWRVGGMQHGCKYQGMRAVGTLARLGEENRKGRLHESRYLEWRVIFRLRAHPQG